MSGDELPGLGSKKTVPRLAPGVDWSKHALDPVSVFVLSRVDGRTTLGEICLLAPFPEAETVKILDGLRAAGLLEIPSSGPAPVRRPTPPVAQPSTPREPTTPAQRAVNRVREITPPAVLATHSAREHTPPRVARAAAAPPLPERVIPSDRFTLPDDVPPDREVTAPMPRVDLSDEPGGSSDRPHQWPEDRSSVAAPPAADAIELPLEVQRRVDEMLALLARGDPFLLLGLSAGTDKKEVRRSYFRLSKEFHPDRYFGKKLGPYARKMQQVFTALTEAFQIASK